MGAELAPGRCRPAVPDCGLTTHASAAARDVLGSGPTEIAAPPKRRLTPVRSGGSMQMADACM